MRSLPPRLSMMPLPPSTTSAGGGGAASCCRPTAFKNVVLRLVRPTAITTIVSTMTFLLLLLPNPTIFGVSAATKGDTDRQVQILNESGHRLEIYWIHATTGEMVIQTTPHVFNGAVFHLNSFVGHKFQIRELPSTKSGRCGEDERGEGPVTEGGKCRTNYFTVNENYDQVIFVRKGIQVHHQDDKTVAHDSAVDAISSCQEDAKRKLLESSITSTDDTVSTKPLTADEVSSLYDELLSCVQTNVEHKLAKSAEELAFQSSLRNKMGHLIETYTCVDDTLNTTLPKETVKWRSKDVQVLHDRDSSQIHIIDDFVTQEECEAVMELGYLDMTRVVAKKVDDVDGDGGSGEKKKKKKLGKGEHLTATKSDVKVLWTSSDKSSSPVTKLARRVLDYTQDKFKLFHVEYQGQEPLSLIQFDARGSAAGSDVEEKEEVEYDQDLPHCDGECNGLDYRGGGRIATFIMICNLPYEKKTADDANDGNDREYYGAPMNFRNAGVHIKPKVGMGIYVSYMNPKTEVMDKGFTEYSTCPLKSRKGGKGGEEGEGGGEETQTIITSYVRLGVDERTPWTDYVEEEEEEKKQPAQDGTASEL